MPPRQTRRAARRRVAPAPAPLPRPAAAQSPAEAQPTEPEAEHSTPLSTVLARGPATRRQLGVRAHHVQEDLSHVRTDLIAIAIVSAITLAFVVGMSFLF